MPTSIIYSYSQSSGDLIWAFITAFLCLLLLSPFLHSNKSFFDNLAARKVLGYLRLAVVMELISNAFLLFMFIYKGPPLTLHAVTDFGNNSSWIYGFPMPVFGLVFITLGTVVDMHFLARFMCLFGALLQAISNAISAVQIHDLLFQISFYKVQPSNYSYAWLAVYYYRNIFSFALCVFIALLCAHFTSIIGCFGNSFISYQVISGGGMDRCEVMRQNREIRIKSYLIMTSSKTTRKHHPSDALEYKNDDILEEV